jgi:hypothetical protein
MIEMSSVSFAAACCCYLSILTNRDVIALNQDTLGVQGQRVQHGAVRATFTLNGHVSADVYGDELVLWEQVEQKPPPLLLFRGIPRTDSLPPQTSDCNGDREE